MNCKQLDLSQYCSARYLSGRFFLIYVGLTFGERRPIAWFLRVIYDRAA
jgi:hypothetical protein